MPGRTKATAMITPPTACKRTEDRLPLSPGANRPVGISVSSSALKIPIPTKMASFEPNRRIPASLKIRGIPPPTAPKKKNRAETAAFVVSSRLMPLEKSTIPAQPPTANHKRKGMDFPGSLKIRLTEVIRRS